MEATIEVRRAIRAATSRSSCSLRQATCSSSCSCFWRTSSRIADSVASASRVAVVRICSASSTADSRILMASARASSICLVAASERDLASASWALTFSSVLLTVSACFDRAAAVDFSVAKRAAVASRSASWRVRAASIRAASS